MWFELCLPTSGNKTRPMMFQKAQKYVIQPRKVDYMPHQNGILHSSWLTSRNAAPSIGSVYKVPTLFVPFLFCDVIADKAYSQFMFKNLFFDSPPQSLTYVNLNSL